MISGEIVVCARRNEGDEFRVRSRDRAQADYAAATMNSGRGRKPDFAPPPCKPSLLTFCPKFGSPPPRAVEIDFSRLPEAPRGSDAARLNEEEPRP